VRFEKWTALGNDYLIVEAAALPLTPSPERIKRLCGPHFGVGSDGLLLLAPVEDPAYVAELRIFNPDGSEAELSGNGARQAVLYLRRSGWTDADEFTILTKAGPITPTIRSDREATLEMGRASTASADYPTGSQDGRGEGAPGPSSTSRSATLSARSRPEMSSSPSTWRRSAPRSRPARCSPTGPT
jgi:diaminopimelate epimerase